jgi:mercuric ion binding protein
MKTQIRGALIGCLAAGLAASGGLAAERTVTLEVDKLSCGACRYIVKKTLAKVPGVSRAKFSLSKDTVFVTFDDAMTDTAALIAATKAIGFPSEVIE